MRMALDVAYVSDQRFFHARGQWYTTASFPLEFISRHLELERWTFWGRLDETEDPSRLFPLITPPALAGKLFFAGPRNQRSGPLGYARAAVYARSALKRVVRRSNVIWLKQPTVFAVLAHRFCKQSQVVVSQQVSDGEAGLVMTYPQYRFLRHVSAHYCRKIGARADVAAFVSRQLAGCYGRGRTDLMISNESRISDDMILSAPPEPVEGPLEVAFIGRLAPEKCVDDLLEAVAAVPEAHLTIIGDGPKRPALEECSRALGLGGRVTWCGNVPWGSGLLEILCRSSVLALPSATEGLPLVIIEAMSQGVPVVATRTGGISEVVDEGVSGLLVDVHRPDQIADAFRLLINQPQLRQAMARAALETARRHTLQVQMGPLLERIRQTWRAKSGLRRVSLPAPAGASHP